MIPRFHPDYRWSDLLTCVLPSKPNAVKKLEKAFAELSTHGNAVAFRYGRSGLYYLLKALGAESKKVILPSYTCVVVANAVVLSGNIPVFLDNAPGKFQPDADDYLNAIDENTVMIVPTHVFGLPQETSELYRQVKMKFPNVFVLQDCAHSFFCHDSTGRVVTEFGDGALFGMNISKLVNSVKGGILTLRDSALAEKVRIGFSPEPARNEISIFSRLYAIAAALAFAPFLYELVYFLGKKTSLLNSELVYFDSEVADLPKDFNIPMSTFEATIGLKSLARFQKRVAERKLIAKYYIDQIHTRGIKVQMPPAAQGATWSHFPILVLAEKRNFLQVEIAQKTRQELGIIIDYSVADLEYYKKNLSSRTCPNAVDCSKRVLNLPLTYREGLFENARWEHKADAVLNSLKDLI